MFLLSTNIANVLSNAIVVNDEFIIIDSRDEIQHEVSGGGWFSKPIKSEDLIVSLCISGEARLRLGVIEYDVTKNCVVTIYPGTVVDMVQASPDYSFIMFAVKTSFIQEDIANIDISQAPKYVHHMPCYQLTGTMAEIYRGTLLTMVETARWKENPWVPGMIRKYIQILYSCIYPVIIAESENIDMENCKSKQKNTYFQFTELVKNHFREERSVQFYAERLGITPKHLSKIVLLESGNTALRVIEEYVILEAKALLKDGHHNINQVSRTLNFANQNVFGKYFKRIVGITPNEYKNMK